MLTGLGNISSRILLSTTVELAQVKSTFCAELGHSQQLFNSCFLLFCENLKFSWSLKYSHPLPDNGKFFSYFSNNQKI